MSKFVCSCANMEISDQFDIEPKVVEKYSAYHAAIEFVKLSNNSHEEIDVVIKTSDMLGVEQFFSVSALFELSYGAYDLSEKEVNAEVKKRQNDMRQERLFSELLNSITEGGDDGPAD